jgi:DNA-binding CsgD family transcriptional regulator
VGKTRSTDVDLIELHCYAFDNLQVSGITASVDFLNLSTHFYTLDQEIVSTHLLTESYRRVYVYHLTPGNFEGLVFRITQQHADEPSAQQILVSAIPSLAYLGLNPHKFPTGITYLFLNEFVSELKNSTKASLFLERAHNFSNVEEKYFNQHDLTKIQIRLLMLLAKGLTNAEIAKTMILSEKGVESAIKRLALKLDCYRMSRSQQNLRVLLLRRYAQLLGLI